MDTPKVKRPTTCGGLFVTHPELAAKGCKRLPRHGGEHRATLHVAAARKTVKASPKGKVGRMLAATRATIIADLRSAVGAVGRKRLTAVQRRNAFGILNSNIDAGIFSASDGLAIAARLI